MLCRYFHKKKNKKTISKIMFSFSFSSSFSSILLSFKQYNFTFSSFSSLSSFLNLFLILFHPSKLIKQFLLTILIKLILFLLNYNNLIFNYILSYFNKKYNLIYSLNLKLKYINDYYEWKRLITLDDEYKGYIDWIENDKSNLYDYIIIKKRIININKMEYSRDIFGLMYRLRGALARDQYGLLHDGLYSLAKSGTKQLVKQYYQTISSALNFICDHDDDSEVFLISFIFLISYFFFHISLITCYFIIYYRFQLMQN